MYKNVCFTLANTLLVVNTISHLDANRCKNVHTVVKYVPVSSSRGFAGSADCAVTGHSTFSSFSRRIARVLAITRANSLLGDRSRVQRSRCSIAIEKTDESLRHAWNSRCSAFMNLTRALGFVIFLFVEKRNINKRIRHAIQLANRLPSFVLVDEFLQGTPCS